MKERLRNRKEPIIILLMVIAVAVAYPILYQGIICNDELQLRLYGQMGPKTLFVDVIKSEYLAKGRFLATLGNLKFVTFFSDNIYVFRTIEVAVLLAGMGLYGYLAYRLTKSKTFGIGLSCVTLAMLPITFEHAVPNSFMISTWQPAVLTMLSILFFLRFLEKRRKRDLVFCCLFYLWAMFLYEIIVTYVFIYFLIHWIKRLEEPNTKKKWMELIQAEIPIVITSCLYLLLYAGQRFVFPSEYSGNQVGFDSLASVWAILKMLFVSALPGYYTFGSAKYQYLFDWYREESIAELITNPRIILVFFALSYCLFLLWSCSDNTPQKGQFKKTIAIGIVALLYAFLPALPNSVSRMYQGAVTPESFTSLPVSLYLYLSIMFGLSYLVWRMLHRVNSKWITAIAACVIALVACNIQIENGVFSHQQYKDYTRLVAVENVLSSGYMQNYDGEKIAAPSFFETRNLLAVEDKHWSEFAQIYYDIEVEKADNLSGYEYFMTIQEDNAVLLETPTQKYLLCPKEVSGTKMIKLADGTFAIAEVNEKVWDEERLQVYAID